MGLGDSHDGFRTLLSFVDPSCISNQDGDRDSFTIQPVHNPDLAGKTFRELTAEVRQQILDYEFSVHILPSDTDDREVLQIFARMNSTGLKLNDQELRNAAFFGVFKELVYGLALEQLDRWRAWRIFSETDIARMQEAEETSDIILTMLIGIHGKRQTLIDDLYEKYDESFPPGAEVSRRFRAVMDMIDDTLGDDLPNLSFRRKPLFHTLFTFYYDLLFTLKSSLKRTKAKALPREAPAAVRDASEAIVSGDLPEELAKLLRGATGHLPSRRVRFEFLQEILSGKGKQRARRTA